MDKDIDISASSIGSTHTSENWFLVGMERKRVTVVVSGGGNDQCIILISKSRLKRGVDCFPEFELLRDIHKPHRLHHLTRVLLLVSSGGSGWCDGVVLVDLLRRISSWFSVVDGNAIEQSSFINDLNV